MHDRDHLANERTFLAWIRTSIGIMAFGFVIEKFSFFMKQIPHFLGETTVNVSDLHQGIISHFGIFLVAFGALLGLIGFIQYKRIEKQINQEKYQPSSFLAFILTLLIICTGIFLVLYLIYS